MHIGSLQLFRYFGCKRSRDIHQQATATNPATSQGNQIIKDVLQSKGDYLRMQGPLPYHDVLNALYTKNKYGNHCPFASLVVFACAFTFVYGCRWAQVLHRLPRRRACHRTKVLDPIFVQSLIQTRAAALSLRWMG